MITIRSAIKIVSRETAALNSERVDIRESLGRILAQDVVADMDLPPFDRSQMDGYAVIATDTTKAPVELTIIGESAAGSGFDRKLKSGETVRIMTGARVPAGADAVQKIELTDDKGFADRSTVTILSPVKKGTAIVGPASEIKKGSRVIRSGEKITSANISVLAAFGVSTPKVSKRPNAAIIGTGSEIVDIASRPRSDQIRNSNSVMLKALAEDAGAVAEIFPNVGDDLNDLKRAIKTAAKGRDIVMITGGVSVGKYDLTKLALLELGAEIFFDKVRLKPGKPAVFARLGKTLVFALPGNPVSAAVTFHLFVRRAIAIMQGSRDIDLPTQTAIAAARVKAPAERDALIPARLSTDRQARLIAAPQKWIGSSDLVGASRGDCYIFVPKGSTIDAGSTATVMII